MEEGDHLIQLAEQDPQMCLAACRRILSQVGPVHLSADAHRAMGIAHRSLGGVEDSIRDLEVARDLYRKAEDTTGEAETTISLAASIAMSGKLAEAIDSLDFLLDHDDGSVRAHTQVQKAGLVARTGDLAGAIPLYELAQPALEALNDLRWLALLHSTRGLVNCYLSRFGPAEADLMAARHLFLHLHRESSAAEMLHNLGFVAVQRGDIARGLSLLLEAEDSFREAGLPIEAISSDRSYAYMLAGLPGSAFEVASVAARRFASQARELERVEALQLAARAALANGDAFSALETADEAVRLASDQGRPAWQLMASVVREEARLRAGLPGDPRELVDLGEALFEVGNLTGETHALALASLRYLEDDDLSAAESILSRIERGDGGPTELAVRLLVAVARAKLMLTSTRREAALEILEEAAELVDQYRVVLSATEARAGVSLLADEIAGLGLQAIHRHGPSVMAWAERFRGASLRIAPVVMLQDTELATTLGELRGMARELEELARAGEDPGDLPIRARRLERRIRDLAMARDLDPNVSSTRYTVPQIIEALGSRLMLYIYDVADRSYGELVSSDGVEMVDLGDSDRLRFLSDHLASGLRREFMGQGRAPSHPSRVDAMIAELAGYLLAPVADAGSDLIVVPPPDLMSLPWNALAHFINPKVSAVVSPSAGFWVEADKQARRHNRLVAVAGPRLEYATIEAEHVAGFYDGTMEVLANDKATVDAVAERMASCDLLHAVAHTRLRHDNPMFSALELADGFLNLYDLERLHQVPDTVVLSACDSALGNVVSGYEMYGLTSVLLSRGARSIIATVAPIPDSRESVYAVGRIHSALSGYSTAAAAVHGAQTGSGSSAVDPSVAFVAYGA